MTHQKRPSRSDNNVVHRRSRTWSFKIINHLRDPGDDFRYPTGDITLRRWLTDYIAHAFRNVQLDGGLTIYEGESRDRYGDAREERLALSAERIDWRRVPVGDLVARHCALSFLDAQGFRFYTPAIMTVIVNDLDSNGVLTESFLFHIHDIRASCKVRDTHYCTLYNQAQRAAIIRFVKYLAHNVRGGWHDDAMDRTLTKLPECCRQPQHSG